MKLINFQTNRIYHNKIENFFDLVTELFKVKKLNYFKFFIKLCIKKVLNLNLKYPDFKHIKVNKFTKIDRTGRYDSRVKKSDIIFAEKKIKFL